MKLLIILSKALLAIYTCAAIAFCFYAKSTNDIGLQMLSLGLVLAPFAAMFLGAFLLGRLTPSARARTTLRTPASPTNTPIDRLSRSETVQTQPVPDEVYWAEAHMADVETGDAFRAFIDKACPTARLPMPPAAQIDRIATWFDTENAKRNDYVCVPPIAVIRAPRATQDVTKGGHSWFGGRPMLGDQPWPLTSDGQPMHHRATIDLAEVSAFAVPPGLPNHGKLAFFAYLHKEPYEGKVLYVPAATTPTLPPENLPHIFYEGAFSFGRKDYTALDAPKEYLHWQVGFMELPMDQSYSEKSARDVLNQAFPDASRINLHTAALADVYPDITQPLFWDSAQRYAKIVTLAETHLEDTIRDAQFRVNRGDQGAAAQLAYLQENTHALRRFIDEVTKWARPHDRWDAMTGSDRLDLSEFMARLTPDNPDALGLHLYFPVRILKSNMTTISPQCDATLRCVARGPEALYQRLPQPVKDRLDQTHRLPGPSQWHQMFGMGVSVQVAGEEHQYDHLLLQLQTDHMMNGEWAGSVVVQYWISPENLRRQAWDQVVVTMEAD
ncbi:DUF1963 domain-containing protein [Yoonia sp. BS5-3]|uniref:DUF1963 domain-containing protein n=1 Tax=Yoonia phaeophyticola TaxID=3137369 RepID=A0ABZ2V0N5_9RHOB